MKNECEHEIIYIGPSSAETNSSVVFNHQCKLCKVKFTQVLLDDGRELGPNYSIIE